MQASSFSCNGIFTVMLVCTHFLATADPLIDAAFATLLHQNHINRSFISHQKPFASPRVKTAEIEQTGNFCLRFYLFFLCPNISFKHLRSGLSVSKLSLLVSVIFLQRKQNYSKRDPNGWSSQTACRGTCSLPVVIPSVHGNPVYE